MVDNHRLMMRSSGGAILLLLLGAPAAAIAEHATEIATSSSSSAVPSHVLDDPYQMNVTVIDRVVKWANNGTAYYDDGDHDGDGPPMTQFQLNLVGYLLMSSFLLILSVILGLLVYSIVRRRHLLFLFAPDQHPGGRRSGDSTSTAGGSPSRSMQLRIQRRYETIEHWIITKRVQPHDDFCEKVVTNFGHHHHHSTDDDAHANNAAATTTTAPPAAANNEAKHNGTALLSSERQPICVNRCQPALESDQDQRECPICLSALTTGQIVSWSANEKCNHVYHHQCVKEWLLRHVECCLCKNTFLPVDLKKGGPAGAKAQAAALQELSCEYAAASATSYYCERTGLVRIPRSVRCTKTELAFLEHRIFEGTVPPAKLTSMRGCREGSTSRTNDDNVFLVPTLAAASTGFLAHQTETMSSSSSSTATTSASVDGRADNELASSPLITSPLSSPAAFADHNDPAEASSAVSSSHEDEEQQRPHRPQSETVSTSAAPTNAASLSPSQRDVELGVTTSGDDNNNNGQELFTASYHLKLEKSRFGDNRCCILQDSSDDSVEVRETSSSGHILEEEELSDHQHDTMDEQTQTQ